MAKVLLGGAALLGVLAAVQVRGVPERVVRAAVAEGHGDKAVGATLFHKKGCEHCHGVDGNGGELGPDLSTVGKRRTPEYMEHQIREGGGGMPAFGEALEPAEIANLLAYLETKRKSPKK